MNSNLFKAGVAAFLLVFSVSAANAQVVPGYTVEVYANVIDPIELAFDPTGILYVGRDNAGSGGGTNDAVRIHRVGLGGAPVVEYGNDPINDPDSVVVDSAGLFGTPGAVLVAGATGVGGGNISTIHPATQNVSILFGPDDSILNVNDMKFDNMGRLLLAENSGNVLVSTGAMPSVLFSIGVPNGQVDIAASDNIYTAALDGVVRVHASDGTLIDNSFVTGLGMGQSSKIAIGSGTLFGNDLLIVDFGTGDLLRVDSLGNSTVIGTGFSNLVTDIEFGPDGFLYISEAGNDRVLRIIPEPASLALLGVAAMALIRRRR